MSFFKKDIIFGKVEDYIKNIYLKKQIYNYLRKKKLKNIMKNKNIL